MRGLIDNQNTEQHRKVQKMFSFFGCRIPKAGIKNKKEEHQKVLQPQKFVVIFV
jgi:hypothetical protein